MSGSEASQQANRAGMDPKRLVVIAYLVFGFIIILFLDHLFEQVIDEHDDDEPEHQARRDDQPLRVHPRAVRLLTGFLSGHASLVSFLIRELAGQEGFEPPTRGFGDRCSTVGATGLEQQRQPIFPSLCVVCLRHRGQNLLSSSLSCCFRRFLVVE